jgi:hypothetical protein
VGECDLTGNLYGRGCFSMVNYKSRERLFFNCCSRFWNLTYLCIEM